MRKTQRNGTRRSVVLVWMLALLSCSATALPGGLQAWLDKTQIGEGQTVQLNLAAQADTAGEPELSPLRKHFDIRNVEQFSHLQMLHGRPSPTRTWQLTLTPKHPGRLTVPALRVGQAVSAPLTLEVLPAVQVGANRVLRDVMLQTDVSQQRPYVQGQVIYTLRLYTRLDLRQVHFSEPEVLGAIVERLGEDTKYNTYFGRYRYHVLQRRFALFPQRSGPLAVISPLLNAQVREEKRQWPLQLRGPEITLDVQPQPDADLHPWLPAESLSLRETWSPDPPRFSVGEPVKRSITITAHGVAAAQLPDLPATAPQGINVYPERPAGSTGAANNTLVTRKIFNYALVADRPGNYRLPEISLTWWDTATGQRRTEILAARDITVLPGTAPAEAATQPTGNGFSLPDINPGAWWQAARNGWMHSGSIWPWVILLVAAAGLVSRLAWWRGRRTRHAATSPRARSPEPQPQHAGDDAFGRFQRACKQGDPHLARAALLAWSAATWPDDPPQRLDQLAERLPPQANDQLAGIDRALYASTGDAWDGTIALASLQPLLQHAMQHQDTEQDKQALPPLYSG
jgi:hypothetical protein